MKQIVFFIAFSFLLTSCDWFKKKDVNSDETYTIGGTMYAADGITPLVGKTLEFKARGIGFSQSNSELLTTTTTDSNGHFSASYLHFDKTAHDGITIFQPSHELPVYGPFLRHVPVNENVNHDICLVPREYYQYIISFKNMKINDTLYIASARLPSELNSYPVKLVNKAAFFTLKDNPLISDIFSGSSDGSLKGSGLSIKYSTSKKDFDFVYNGSTVPANYKEIITYRSIETKTFPVVNTIEIVIE
ncbi:MAG: hypothetical protein ACPGEG_09200 [Salibacteraceae bacterium]